MPIKGQIANYGVTSNVLAEFDWQRNAPNSSIFEALYDTKFMGDWANNKPDKDDLVVSSVLSNSRFFRHTVSTSRTVGCSKIGS